MRRVYLDWNATTPPLPAALDAMREAYECAWGNPASVHEHGRRARAVVEDARNAVADLAGCDARDVTFTSGGTEANNIGLTALMAAGGVLLASRLEHASVARLAERWGAQGRARWLRVSRDGRVDLGHLGEELARGDVRVVAVQAVNHETGAVQPAAEVIERAHAAGARVHVDAVPAWGKVERPGEGADTRSLGAHKFRGPKGIGALIVRPGIVLSPVLLGGGQERGVRPGTVDAALCAGLAVAARHARSGVGRYADLAALRDRLEAALIEFGAVRNAPGAARAPHVTSLAFERWAGPELVAALDLEGVSVSGGSACSAGTMEPSAGIAAAHGEGRARSTVRLSLGETTTGEDVAFALAAFRSVLDRPKKSDEGSPRTLAP